MSVSLGIQHLRIHTAEDIHEMFRRLGYDVFPAQAFEGRDLADLELDDADLQSVKRAYVVAQRDAHTVYLFEVDDLRATRLRGLAWNALQRGTALLAVTQDYREVMFVDPRFVGKPNKSNVRVNKLKVIASDPTRHDVDTLNAIHAHHRTGQQIYDYQAQAFNVTTVTKKFYEEYHRHYELARALIRQYNPGIREFVDEDQTSKLHAFTQRLLGRLMFLYFLQRKGWLAGRGKFLTEKYAETLRQHSGEVNGDGETFNYYLEVLEPLFFKTMNTKRPDDITIWPNTRIPYLNGGLFDEARDPEGPIFLPDSLFDPNSNDGLLAFFNRYNFTIAEDTPLEQDVAVDPEMLGKVFENMLEERDRGQSGSFYTPRAIVAYMCQEALAGYLEESADVPRETTRDIFDPDANGILAPEQAQRVSTALDTLTVLDPAVGSGSFLIGMLQEIIRLRRACAAATNTEITPALLADWKEAIIRDTLYGVDIKPEAIEIAQLRLWLALVVDQTLAQARPLPNLDYKLMAGNSLIETIDGEPVLGEFAQSILQPKPNVQWDSVRDQLEMFEPNQTQARMLLFDEEKQVQHERIQLDALRREFFKATPERRRQLREEITTQERRIVYASLSEKAKKHQDQINHLGQLAGKANGNLKPADQRKLTTAAEKLTHITRLQEDMQKPDYVPPFFLYRLHFSEVFERKGGFDVLIANPPYVDQRRITDQKAEFQRAYPKVYSGNSDLYVYFFARGLALLRNNGVLAYISSNKYMRAAYGEKLRGVLANSCRIFALIDFADLPVFDAAAYPAILIGSKSTPNENEIAALTVKEIDTLHDLANAVLKKSTRLKQDRLDNEQWQLGQSDNFALLQKIVQKCELLSAIDGITFYRGISTGLNEAFVIDAKEREILLSSDPKSNTYIKPYLSGREISRWRVDWNNNYLLFIDWNFPVSNYPAILDHLQRYKEPLSNRPEVIAGRFPWYALSRYASNYFQEFDKPKIVWAKYGLQTVFAYDTTHLFPNNTTFIMPIDDHYMLGLLNSKVISYCARLICNSVRGGYLEFNVNAVGKFPIARTGYHLREQIGALARRCLDAAKDNPSALPVLEAELNALVYQAYGLDDDDIAVIEGYLAGRGAAEQVDEDLESSDES